VGLESITPASSVGAAAPLELQPFVVVSATKASDAADVRSGANAGRVGNADREAREEPEEREALERRDRMAAPSHVPCCGSRCAWALFASYGLAGDVQIAHHRRVMRPAFPAALWLASVPLLAVAPLGCGRGKSVAPPPLPATSTVASAREIQSTAPPAASSAFVEASPPPPPPACPPGRTPPVSGTREITLDGRTRTFAVDYPPRETSLDAPKPAPLVLAFHGWGGTPEQLERTTKIAASINARGWIAVRPAGIDKSFNAGTCCGQASKVSVDDVAFARKIVAIVEAEACVDKKRVFSTGFSNGGFLSHRLGCEASDTFAAIASVGGTFGIQSCAPPRPVPVLQVHGARDAVVKWDGTPKSGWSSVATVLSTWRKIDGCGDDEPTAIYAHGNVTCTRASACSAGSELILCRDKLAGHTWPGGPTSTGKWGSQDLDATSYLLDFFARHPMP
jgi:polyhydroxybutyrate depolymerase